MLMAPLPYGSSTTHCYIVIYIYLLFLTRGLPFLLQAAIRIVCTIVLASYNFDNDLIRLLTADVLMSELLMLIVLPYPKKNSISLATRTGAMQQLVH